MPTASLSFFCTIDLEDKHIGVPSLQRVKDDLDAHGTFLDLPRLPGEVGSDYWKRLMAVIPLRGGSHQEGLVHGITRELGLEEKIAIKISPVSLGDRWIAPSPKVEVTSTTLVLYSSYVSSDDYTIDMSIDIFDHGDGYLVGDLVTEIQSSEYFVAELGPYMTGNEKSNGLVPSSSDVLIEREWVPGGTNFFLENSDVVPGSLSFTEKDVFKTEHSREVATGSSTGLSFSAIVNSPVVDDGQYYVDYQNASVITYTPASGFGTCRYIYRDFPWQIRWSPIVVYSLRDDNYRDKLFEDEVMTDNSTQQGVVTSEGKEVYDQLFKKSPCMWGA